ncbi:hypothetical protein [Paenibacillus xylanexedens]|nr:hypothetical protein [Paenibacillus xylanexedens]
MDFNADLLGLAAVILAGGVALALLAHGFSFITVHKHYHRKDDAN